MLFNNHRSVSILRVQSKCVGKIMHTRLSQFVEAHKILFKTQLGFLKQYSVDIAPLVLREKIQNCAENGDFFVAIYLDFSWYGTRDIELDWFKN